MKGIVLSGGTGSRLRPITHTGPKQLVPVANKPILQYAIEDLSDAGITDIGVILGNTGSEAIQEFLGDGSEFDVEITYIVQGNPLGLAHAVGCAASFVGDDDFVVYLGDNLLKLGINDLLQSFQQGSFAAGISLQRVENPGAFGIATLDDNGNVQRLIEKPETPPSDLALVGIYVFSAAVFEVIDTLEPSWRGELEITDAIQGLLDTGHAVDAHVVEGWWKDTGRPEDIIEANRLVLEECADDRAGTIDEGAEVRGCVALHDSSRIDAGAVVRGPVSIGADATISAGSYVGPYTSIGPDSTIEGAHIQNCVLMRGCEITAEVTIVDSLLGRGTVVESAEGLLPEGHRLVTGENSTLTL